MAEFDGFEFIITEEDDIMLIIYARTGIPENPMIKLNLNEKSVIFYRNKDDIITLENVSENIMQNLNEESALLIAEVAPTENPLEHELKSVYEAQII